MEGTKNARGSHATTKVKNTVRITWRECDYTVDVEGMYQVNDRTKTRRAVWREQSVLEGSQSTRSCWYFDASSRRNGMTGSAKWVPYAIDVQKRLEHAFRNTSRSQVVPNEGVVAGQHSDNPEPLIISRKPLTIEEFLSLVEGEHAKDISREQARAACDAALEPGTNSDLSFRIIRVLRFRCGFRFAVDDARRAALFIGSMGVLRLVLLSDPGLQLLGHSIFDKRYPRFANVSDHEGRKNCIKALLVRGAQLGDANNVPSSKLLRKIDADMSERWVDRYLCSMSFAGMELPDHVQERIVAFCAYRSRRSIATLSSLDTVDLQSLV
eukprot:TRINITY_DN56396_c0_g1_i1.p1 TRINITY_DN56396_c0_g1~~TRINITY_DN56396_c0_g1_i1.p1  ORF type:complete len:325 (-),score=30.50 TRINITY_DN56396_c0_g1_i1:96-1070(-)